MIGGVNIYKKFNEKEYEYLNLKHYGTGKGIKVATAESVNSKDVFPYKINGLSSGSKHGKQTAITCLEVAPEIELYSFRNINESVDYIIKEGIKVLFASIGNIQIEKENVKRLKDNGVILIKSSGNDDGKPVSDTNQSGDWINISSVGLDSKGNVYHSPFSKKHNYIDFASFGYISLPDLPDDRNFAKHFTGTSFSCPIVAGIVALILEQEPNLNHTQIYEILKDNSERYGLSRDEVGNGVIKLPREIDYSKYMEVDSMDFKDIDKDRWSYGNIKKAVDAGIMEGYPDETFRPKRNVNREELATVVAKLLDK